MTQKVKVYVRVCGNYCKFHEMGFDVIYDITNNIQLADWELNEISAWEDDDYDDVDVFDAVLFDGRYYVRI